MNPYITGKFTHVLLKAMLKISDKMRCVIQDGIPAIYNDHGVVHLFSFVEENSEKVQDNIIIGEFAGNSPYALEKSILGSIDNIIGRDHFANPGLGVI